ncbi:hypothetical protein SAMN02910275_01365 [Butyrivibrio sp. INlla18]|uniref:hypothetical protein n=1 Tax=Butyrivibrio sp. INlla18 TaxID=1520806 RepID=UPI000889816B|nr:hypothetical protein [Butyrivibrio sp. INlla18]SDA57972.1 hypothetical protein SAMN02910275_01365 [Butyrivibrio sp. INlla18]
MRYVIQSGKYETGTKEQQESFKQILGADVLQKFDLYFHWYNIIHELGHCFAGESNIKQDSNIEQEMFVNEFAVGYYLYVGETQKLDELKLMVETILEKIPSPMPEGEAFLDFYKRIWNTDAIMQVMIYGYFQFRSVLEALNKQRNFKDIASELGYQIHSANIVKCEGALSSENAEKFLNVALENMKNMEMDIPSVSLKLMDDPTIQCVQAIP